MAVWPVLGATLQVGSFTMLCSTMTCPLVQALDVILGAVILGFAVPAWPPAAFASVPVGVVWLTLYQSSTCMLYQSSVSGSVTVMVWLPVELMVCPNRK